jgi:hypothetical protein
MNVTLIHPQHGRKVATLQAEVDADIARGWEVEKPAAARKRRAKDEAEVVLIDAADDVR